MFAPVELEDGGIGSGLPAGQVLGERPHAQESHDLHPDVGSGESLTDQRVAGATTLLGPHEEPVQLGSEHDREGGGSLATFVAEQGHGNRPAVAHSAHHVVPGTACVGQEHLVELGVTRHHLDRTDLDPWLVHGDEQEGDPLVLRHIGVGAGQDEDPIGQVPRGGPHLLAVEHPFVAVQLGPAPDIGQVGSGARFRVPLAPDVLTGQDPWQEVGLLFLGAPLQEGVADHLDAEGVVAGPGWHPGPVELLGHHHLFERAEPTTSVCRRPRGGQQSVLVQRLAPTVDEGPCLPGRQRAEALPALGEIGVQEVRDGGAVGLGLGGVGGVHGRSGGIVDGAVGKSATGRSPETLGRRGRGWRVTSTGVGSVAVDAWVADPPGR